MVELIINGRTVEVPEGGSVLDAAERLGIAVPTMCYHEACKATGSCLVCVVKDLATGNMIPSCVAPARDGMEIDTDGPDVRAARRAVLELLLSEHVGDCLAPCTRGCPARLDAPAMIREIRDGDITAALRTLRAGIALPRVIARLCHAPCEKACRRERVDAGLAIRSLEAFTLAAAGPAAESPPATAPPRAGRVLVVGGGVAGLSAAYYARMAGYACVVCEAAGEAGGALRNVSPESLPSDELSADLRALEDLGIELRLNSPVESRQALDALRGEFDVAVLAAGESCRNWVSELDLEPVRESGHASGAVAADGAGSFACGSIVRARPHVIQAMADGRSAARLAAAFIEQDRSLATDAFDSRLGVLQEGELALFLTEADSRPRTDPGPCGVFPPAVARGEAARCMHCDCRRLHNCKLRDHATAYAASQAAFRPERRLPVEKVAQHAEVVYESGKCIRCGLCVDVTARGGEALGLAFVGRGFDVRIGVPYDAPLSDALRVTARACVEVCPTGALAFRSM